MNLAIKGGKKVREKPFPRQITVGEEERQAVNKIFDDRDPLSMFRGNWQPEFWGGKCIYQLERAWEQAFDCHAALAVNSCTSALQIACGAAGIQPGDEVIVTPWSMTCSATAPLVWGGVPVFADIEWNNFCLDPDSVEDRITDKTKAIIAVSLFGQPFDPRLRAIAKKYDLVLIEDAAQAPGATCEGKYTGTLGDIGCFSFTQGKHLTCGEGGILTTKTENLKYRGALIRNHAESVINAMLASDKDPDTTLGDCFMATPNMIGYNMRMTELNAAIISEQLKKLPDFIAARQTVAWALYDGLRDIPCIVDPGIRDNCTHAYYVQPFLYNEELAGIHRDDFIAAVQAELSGEEGRPDRPMIGGGYIKPLYLMPLFQTRNHYALRRHENKRSYAVGSCPTCEVLWRDQFFLSMYHNLPLVPDDIQTIIDAFHKVWEHREEIKHGI